MKRSTAWIDPVTGIHYDSVTMEPLTLAGDDLGEVESIHDGAPLTEADADSFSRMLGLD